MSEYLNELRDSARQVVEGSGTPAGEAATWPLMVELGWLLTAVPEELDGLGLGLQEVCALHTELGRGLCQAPFLPAMLAVDALCQSELENRAEWIAGIAGGDCVTASLGETGVARETDDALTGRLVAVPSADNAGQLLVWTGDGDCVALVETGHAAVTVTARETWDTTRRLFDVTLDRLPADAQVVLAAGGEAADLIRRLETLRDFGLAADALGGGAALLDMTVEHLQTRRQFGRPLALFQALKHRCADMKTLVAGAEAVLADSLASVADPLTDAESARRAKLAKHLACDAFSRLAEEALQLHGGIGMASEHDCHLYLKRAMLSEHLGSGADSYPDAIADALLND